MSEEELVDAYTSGRLGRRAFVRRLMLGGLTATAAVTFADALVPMAAGAAPKKKKKKKVHHHHRRRDGDD
jgi:hypothetical protein